MAIGAMRLPYPGIKYPQVIIDLSDRADRGSGIPATCFLLDRDRRTQAVDPVDFRLRHLPQELASVTGETLHIAPLAFGIQRVKCQRAFAGARHTSKADELIARQDE